MKYLNINLLILGLFAMISLSSCRKKPIYPTDQLPANVPAGIDTTNSIGGWGKFLVIDAVMYVDDKQTGQHFVYNHFGTGKDTSSMRWGGAIYDIETIIKNQTTYSFWKPSGFDGKFVLNNDTTKYYLVHYMGSNRSIIEDPNHGQLNMGGSARPFSGQTLNKANQTVVLQIQEMEGTDNNGHEIHYWTQLTLKKIQTW